MSAPKIGSKEWADIAERAEWGFMAKMLGEAIEKLRPFNLSGLAVAKSIAEERAAKGWREFASKEELQEVSNNGRQFE